MNKVTVEWLQAIDAIKEVPASQLQWLIDNSEQEVIPAGELLFESGTPIRGTTFIISGKVRVYQPQKTGDREVTIMEANTITGYLPFSRGKIATLYGVAIEDTYIMRFPIEKMDLLIRTHFELTQALVHIMTSRVREFTSLQQQSEKMMALGKLSAGLAHELNNPASAVVRGATSLKKHLQLLPESFKQIISIRMPEADVDIVNNKMFAVLQKKERPVLSMMERSAKEDEIMDWLEEHGTANSAEVAENFVDFGFTLEDLEGFKAHIPEAYISPIFNWINTNLVTEKMVTDIEDASQRIAHLVGSVKNFTHMDQGHDKQWADIHDGIRNTLVMLQHKIRKGQVTVTEHFDSTLPPVKALIGELNQVWTNLIDNALDAMESNGSGVLEIKTEKVGTNVQVTVTDNGPGIPEEMITRIFDPFFTTKEIGKGTGLGLDIVMQIIRQHRGTVKVTSTPGHTQFVVCLPVNG